MFILNFFLNPKSIFRLLFEYAIVGQSNTNMFLKIYFMFRNYNNPSDPAVNPIIRKRENSDNSLGRELTISFS